MTDSDLCFLPAIELARLIRLRAVSAREVTEAHLRQIDRFNSKVNAIITLVPDLALAAAEIIGPLHGLPVAHKDLVPTAGIRTTFGSPILAEFVPQQDALIIERLRVAGAITLGKTNVPEFGAGSQTYNTVFGETLNPYDLKKTCGGSSGGAAVALACGMIGLADGGDQGGSLRNPASFCNVVGLRPSPGRVPSWPNFSAWSTLGVEGPMARTVSDTALVLSVLAGSDARSPISFDDGAGFDQPLERDFAGVRIAWSRNLGMLPVDPLVTSVIDSQRGTFADLGCVIDDTEPDFQEADEVFRVMRGVNFEVSLGTMYDAQPDKFKETIAWNIEEGRRLTAGRIAAAERLRTDLFHRVRRFMETHEFLVMPVSQVPPFDVGVRWITEINGEPMHTYIDWMKSCYFISAIGNPAISVPCGFTPDGLPIGVQIVGRHRDDLGVLQLAFAFEQATQFWRRRPAIVEGDR